MSRPVDLAITRATVELLGDIGSEKSLRPFSLLRQLPFYAMVKKDINIATTKIRERQDAEQDK